jgi:thioredoxin 2
MLLDGSKTLTVCNECSATNRVDIDSARSMSPVCGKCKSPLSFSSFISELGLDQLLKIIRRAEEIPVIVDFWAPWCAPCHSFAPTFERVAARHAENFIFVKVDTEAHPAASEAFRIHSIPTLLIFKSGAERVRHAGALGEASFEDWMLNSVRF